MKAEDMTKRVVKFNPVTINITLETEEELARFYCLFTHTAISGFLSGKPGGYSCQDIRDALVEGHGQDIDYGRFWPEFAGLFK